MKNKYIPFLSLMILFFSCNQLDTRVDLQQTWDDITANRNRAFDLGYTPYGYLRNEFYYIDGNIDAALSDEAEQTASTSQTQLFNNGSWNAVSNPDNVYESDYRGIRAATFFLNYTIDYKDLLSKGRDTISLEGKRAYDKEVIDMKWLRAEAQVLRAYFYFDLIKRYGGVPLITQVFAEGEDADIERSSYDEIVNYIVTEIDAVKDSLVLDWEDVDVARDGRLTKGAALALKSRALLYAASPLNNPSNDIKKWEAAAIAANNVIELSKYWFSQNYQNLFLEGNSATENEIIFSIRGGMTNTPEKLNYPIGTPGGASGITPSHNLVEAYEYKGSPDPLDPYKNRDPRLAYTVVTNNSWWNDRMIDISPGGIDDANKPNTSKTGYYLKKFLTPNLNLLRDERKLHNWVVFRFAETFLNYAEAMNEAYGPDDNQGNWLSAREAVNYIRNRNGVQMPPVIATTKEEMRARIKHERRIELAFESHRHWDLLRWKDAETVLNAPIKGVKAIKENTYKYEEFVVEDRKFDASKMYLYPIPQVEINKSKLLSGKLEQNPGW